MHLFSNKKYLTYYSIRTSYSQKLLFILENFKLKSEVMIGQQVTVSDGVKQILSFRTTALLQKGFTISLGLNFPLKNFIIVRSICFTAGEKKTDTLILKVMIKNLYCLFPPKRGTLLSLIIGALVKGCQKRRVSK